MNDRFQAMQLFARVARLGSFSLAGRELGLSQPTASRIVATLEKQVGVPLLRRTTRGVKLTDTGADYLVRTEAILAALEEANQAARGSGELKGVLRIACSSVFAIRRIMPVLETFTTPHPELKLEFLIGDHRHEMAVQGVDVAIRIGPPPDPDAVARKIGTNGRLLVAAPSYLGRHGTPQHPRDLQKHAIIIGPTGRGASGWTFHKSGQKEVLRISGRFVIDEMDAATSAAVNGLGILSTGRLGCLEELRQGALIQVLADWGMDAADAFVVLTDGRLAKPSAKAFADFIVREAQGLLDCAKPGCGSLFNERPDETSRP